MIEPKEKADSLVEYFINLLPYSNVMVSTAKKMANKVVDEIIEQWEYIDTFIGDYGGELNPNLRYWQQVKQHINEYGK